MRSQKAVVRNEGRKILIIAGPPALAVALTCLNNLSKPAGFGIRSTFSCLTESDRRRLWLTTISNTNLRTQQYLGLQVREHHQHDPPLYGLMVTQLYDTRHSGPKSTSRPHCDSRFRYALLYFEFLLSHELKPVEVSKGKAAK